MPSILTEEGVNVKYNLIVSFKFLVLVSREYILYAGISLVERETSSNDIPLDGVSV
jgi:hypothetical protein